MIAIVIVSWNVRDLLRACLRSLERYPATTHTQRIIVVDNASTDGSCDMVRSEFPDVHLLANVTNRGFTGGNNDGIAIAENGFDQSENDHSYVLVLNPDTEVADGTLDTLLSFADATHDAGMVGPQLRYADGSIQSSRRRFPTLFTALFESTWLQSLAPKAILDAYYMRDQPDTRTCDVDWIYGAAMLVRRAAYRQVGILDEKTFFMYSEEVDWCKRLRQAGWRVVYLPQAVIVHHEGRSSDQVSAKRMVYFNTSKVRYFRKYNGLLQATLLRMALLAMFVEQLGLECVKWVVGHKRLVRSERIHAYVSVLKSGLR